MLGDPVILTLVCFAVAAERSKSSREDQFHFSAPRPDWDGPTGTGAEISGRTIPKDGNG